MVVNSYATKKTASHVVATIVAEQQQSRRAAALNANHGRNDATSVAGATDATIAPSTSTAGAAASTSESLAESTVTNHRIGINWFNKLMSAEPSPYPITFDEMTAVDVQNDNLQFMLEEFARRITKTPPCRADTEKMLAATTVRQYFSSAKAAFQAKFPQHYCWKDPSWHAKALQDLDTRMKRLKVNDGDGSEQDATPCIPIYRLNSNMLVRDNTTQPDLTQICGDLLSMD
jgi:hypothetical protein